MFCRVCGKSLEDGVKFCPSCGAPTDPGVPPVSAGSVPAPAPESGGTPPAGEPSAAPGKKLGKKRIVIGIIAAAAVLCVIAGAAAAGLFGGPKAKVARAVSRSVRELSAIPETLGLTGLADTAGDRSLSQSLDLSVDTVDMGSSGASLLEGFGISVQAGADLGGRKLGLSAGLTYGTAELFTGCAAAEDDTVWCFVPMLLRNTAVGLSTSTLGADLVRLGAPGELKDLSFNIFDLADVFAEPARPGEDSVKALLKAVSAEPDGSRDLQIGGSTVKCSGYRVVIPESALRDFLDACRDAVDAREYDAEIAGILTRAGLGTDAVSAFRDSFREQVRASFGSWENMLRELGDIELGVFLNGRRVASVTWETEAGGTPVSAVLRIGGEKDYGDFLSLEAGDGGSRFRFESAGSHRGAGGVFTDESRLTVEGGREDGLCLTSETEYRVRESKDRNFRLQIRGSGFSACLEGILDTGGSSLALNGGELTVDTDGGRVCLACSLSAGSYSGLVNPAEKTVFLSDISEDGLRSMLLDIQDNVSDWLGGLKDMLPDFSLPIF